MNRIRKIDMTSGSIMRLVVLFALPICAGNILQQLYNTVDTLVIGNFCGTVSLAAVGTSSQPVELLLCIFLGLGSGVSILVSQYIGKGDWDTLKEMVSTATMFLYLCAVPITILGPLVSPFILKIMQVPDDAWGYCISYLGIIFLGTLGNMGYNLNAGILRGMGDSQASLLFLVISCIINIILDLLFVAWLKLDVAGAAAATIMAIYISWVCSIWYIKKKYPKLSFTFLPRRINKGLLADIIRIGLPLGLNNSIYSVGHIFLQAFINMQGSIFIAGCSVASRVMSIANVAITSFSSAAATFSGQNIGAQNYHRLKKGARQIPFYSGLITATAGMVLTIFCPFVLQFFTKDAQTLSMAIRYIRVVLPFTWTYAVFNCIINFVNGIGEVKYPTVVNILMLWAVRIPSAYFIAQIIDGTYIMACYPISFIFGMFAMLAYFHTKKWKEIRQLAG